MERQLYRMRFGDSDKVELFMSYMKHMGNPRPVEIEPSDDCIIVRTELTASDANPIFKNPEVFGAVAHVADGETSRYRISFSDDGCVARFLRAYPDSGLIRETGQNYMCLTGDFSAGEAARLEKTGEVFGIKKIYPLPEE